MFAMTRRHVLQSLAVVLAACSCASLFVYWLMQPIPATNGSAAMGSVRTLAAAECEFKARNGRYGTVGELATAKIIDREWHDGVVRNSYRWSFEFAPDGSAFAITAVPLRNSDWWKRRDDWSFYFAQDGIIRRAWQRPADATDPDFLVVPGFADQTAAAR